MQKPLSLPYNQLQSTRLHIFCFTRVTSVSLTTSELTLTDNSVLVGLQLN